MSPTVIGELRIDTRPEQLTMGIRIQTPMRGMFKVVGKLFDEVFAWQKKTGAEQSGLPFLRYYVIDMAGEMDIEAGLVVAAHAPAGSRVAPGVLPGGRYASLVYSGSGLAGNKALLLWARANGLAWDRWNDPKGDAFRCRYEAYLTDPRVEPRKTRWQIEVAIKLAE